MSATTAPRSGVGPRRSTLDRGLAMQIAETEYERLLDQLRALSPADWAQPTECDGWTVRDMAGHCVGMALMATGPRESMRQQLAARRRGGHPLHALTALQTDEHADLETLDLLSRFAEVGPRAARGRRRMPAPVRRLPLPQAQDVGDHREWWTLGYLNDTILTRDPWMHRMDICRATGRTPHLTGGHDGILVGDVVTEWAGRHDERYDLVLEGPAGGRFVRGVGGAEIRMDAIDFCRVLSGRKADHPVHHELLAVAVPF